MFLRQLRLLFVVVLCFAVYVQVGKERGGAIRVFGCLELCFGISRGGGEEFNKKRHFKEFRNFRSAFCLECLEGKIRIFWLYS